MAAPELPRSYPSRADPKDGATNRGGIPPSYQRTSDIHTNLLVIILHILIYKYEIVKRFKVFGDIGI
jgi:hypothetical protein